MTASSVAAVESLSQLTSSRTTIVCTDPATGERIGEAPVMSPDEVRETVRRSHTCLLYTSDAADE